MYHRLTLICLFMVLTACSSQDPLPEEKYYALPKITDVTEGKQLFNIVSIIKFQAGDIYKERAIVYTEDGITLKQYHYHHWVDSPARLLTERLAERLRIGNFAEYVLTTYEGDSELIISGQIMALERIRSGNSDTVRVKLLLQVNASNKKLPVLFKEYSETVAADSHSITDTIMAFGQVVDMIFDQFQKDLREALNNL